ncbi:ATP synthase subunit I [Rhodoferax sp.]|uniref:ATP synthase subunit I n=1 Tax=Rhodoferax sp. TaxID=50421 RepID=UPI0027768C27|nr:ATP synthase subunit I [Rhodoferax sp.]
MPIIRPARDWDAEEPGLSEVEPLSAKQAQALREQSPSLSPWWVVAGQVIVATAVALLAWGFTGRANAGWSAGYGGLVVVIPAALFARGLMSRFSSTNALTASFGFFVWDLVKISVSVVMLVLAPRMVTELDWLALLIGLIVTMKVYWLALLVSPKRRIV